jgi:hypothetical protein
MINYAKDNRRPIISILVEADFQLYGGLGAISATAVQSIVLGKDGVSENVIAQLSNSIPAQKGEKRDSKNVVDPATV